MDAVSWSGVARQLVTFFYLPEKKVTKENGTPTPRPSAALRCSSKWAAAQLSLVAHTTRELLRTSNSARLSSHLDCATRRGL